MTLVSKCLLGDLRDTACLGFFVVVVVEGLGPVGWGTSLEMLPCVIAS